jgi:hypothetical protein
MQCYVLLCIDSSPVSNQFKLKEKPVNNDCADLSSLSLSLSGVARDDFIFNV